MAFAAIFTVGGVLQIVGKNLAMLYAGRLIAGLGKKMINPSPVPIKLTDETGYVLVV